MTPQWNPTHRKVRDEWGTRRCTFYTTHDLEGRFSSSVPGSRSGGIPGLEKREIWGIATW